MTTSARGAPPVALVTGATRGLRLAIARELGRDHHVLVGGRELSAVARVVAELPSASPFVADLADEEALARAFAEAAARVGRMDVLVHNAGVATHADIEASDRSLWRSTFEVNVVAVADLTRLALPVLRASAGTLILVNSGAGVRIYPGQVAYTASKWALRALTECVREQERGRIRVTAVHPGRIDTDMQVALQTQAGRGYDPADHMSPLDVARAVRAAVDMPAGASIDEIHMRTTEAKS
ncbi:SDR family oxidoreductase [Schaalia sp. 19OD2882]|uniref:SDR family oxidoreductase n=1 Tax=Schaalia sp. 19OD2882 TaxID=2794089 RepID=UPI001C1ECA3B|nr:SDR family oxidoreductase [Schaalia sp. 19OD2882]QWW20529.1 SDR family oxidoreductase [Schaalia sp. 19OD2882]